MSGVPTGWKQTTLGELGRYLNGRGFKKSEWRETGRPIIRIQNLTGSSKTFNHFDGEPEERYTARPGDLLVSWSATLGAYLWDGPEAVVNQHIFKVESNIDTKFHKYLLDYKLEALKRETHGSGMVHITRGKFDAVPVAVPIDHSEQRHIVELLDDHFSRLDGGAASLADAEARLRTWRQSSLDHLIWTDTARRPVRELVSGPLRNGHSARASRPGEPGVRTLTLTAVTRGDFSEQHTKLAAADERRVGDLWLKQGDILVQRSNTPELVGTSALFDGPERWAIFPDLLIRLRADERLVLGPYLAAALKSERAHRSLRERAKGLAGSMPKIDQEAIASAIVPVPPLEVQRQIVETLTAQQEVERRLGDSIRALMRRREVLRRALLDAAFSGRLTGRVSDLDLVEELAEAAG